MKMNAQECLHILRKIKDVSFATVDEKGLPQVRIIDVMLVENNKLYFCSARGKDFYKQLIKNNHVALCTMTKNYQMIRYQDLKIVYLELGVGQNTPGIIKYPFFRFVERNKEATYICINKDAYCPRSIEKRAYCINEDITNVLDELYQIQCTND